jgi:hypothetical protein
VEKEWVNKKNMSFSDYSFTPSEFILLNGDKFAPEKNNENSLPLLCSEGSVDGKYLATLMIAAAVLASEDENGLILELTTNRKMLGLKEETHLILRPAQVSPNWNGFTLESGILFIASQAFAVPGDYSVRNTVYNILAQDRAHPWTKIIELVEWGLASSNWLMPVEREASSVFSTPFICPANVRDLALAQPAAPVINLLSTCKKTRPEIWRQLIDEITLAFTQREA